MSLNKVLTERVFFLLKFQAFFDPIASTAATKAGKSAEKNDLKTFKMDSFDHQILLEKSIWLIYWLIVHLPFHLLLGANVEKTVDVRFSVFLLCSFLYLPIFQRKEPWQRLHKMVSVLSKYQFNGWVAGYVVIDVFFFKSL